jgi:hypothetical protein
MSHYKTLALLGAAATLALAHVSRAQVVQGLTSADRQFMEAGTRLYELDLAHRGVRIELRMHTWGASQPGFSVDVWNDDPAAPEAFDLAAAVGSVTLDGQVAGFVPYGPTAERPLGGQRAIVLPSWSTWPASPFTGRDLEFELYDPDDSTLRIAGFADSVRG